jgi:hypothetical protein
MLPSESAPLFITAKTADELRKKMVRVCIERSALVKFFSIYFDGKNHIAWYHPPIYQGGGLF